MSQSVVFNKENPTLVLCGGSRSAPRGTPTWALSPPLLDCFWGLVLGPKLASLLREGNRRIHGKNPWKIHDLPKKKTMENSCNPFSNPQPHPWTPKFMTPTGAEVRPPRRGAEPLFPLSGAQGPRCLWAPLGPRGSLNASATRQMLRLLRSWPSTRRSYVLQDGPAE